MDRSRLWTLGQLGFAAAFLVVGLVLMVIPRDAVAAWVGAREDDLVSAVRFIGFFTIGAGLAFLAPVAVWRRFPHRRGPDLRAWVTAGAALVSLALALLFVGGGVIFYGTVLAALSFLLAGIATCFAIWRDDELNLHAALPRRLQERLWGAPR